MGNFGLIDLDTPEDVYTFSSWRDGTKWTLVFSDEFEEEGRTFYPGEDPYWEAVDLHYWVRDGCYLLIRLFIAPDSPQITWSGTLPKA